MEKYGQVILRNLSEMQNRNAKRGYYMNLQNMYKYYNKKNSLRWLQQGIIDKHFFKPKGKEYHFEIKQIAGRKVFNLQESNEYISKLINSGEPFWVARYGHTEMQFINAVLYNRFVNGKITPENSDIESRLAQLCNNAGFFPNDKDLGIRYVDMVLDAAKDIDVHAIWGLWMEDYMLAQWEPEAKITRWGHIAPYYQRKENGELPWTHALKGKKVLVINPFTNSISAQYENNRERLFAQIYAADDILPQFELKLLKSVQTAGGTKDNRFSTWFEALEWMIEECRKIDFDVALVGCGAYGYLLASAIKKMGKGAIQTCGSTQMLFGVLGKRWTGDKQLMEEVVNQYWIRPSADERPETFSKVESGCYW